MAHSLAMIVKMGASAVTQIVIQALMIVNFGQQNHSIEWLQLNHDAFFMLLSVVEGALTLIIGERYEQIVIEIDYLLQFSGKEFDETAYQKIPFYTNV